MTCNKALIEAEVQGKAALYDVHGVPCLPLQKLSLPQIFLGAEPRVIPFGRANM